MQAADFVKYIKDPKLLDKESITHLQKLVIDFPYFQSAHILLSIASKKWDAAVYQQSLKTTAIVSASRSHLFKLIHQEDNTEVETIPEPAVVQISPDLPEQREDDSKLELDILKAAEISVEPAIRENPEKEDKAEPHRDEKKALNAEEILEREIGKEIVNSFVEKEILKTPEADRPAAVKEDPPENFSQWLYFLKKNNGLADENGANVTAPASGEAETGQPTEAHEAEPAETTNEISDLRKQKNKAIIDKIIESSPGIIRQKEEQRFYAPDIKAKESLRENEHLVTETLAKIYALQGSISKAIRAYEILSLKHPQKRAYFDTLIQKLKKGG